ncbi:MAG: AAA family ATPase [Syntrophomonas sp.]|nr:AAA family ATPase [Syntrophomonas sp.]
MKGETGLKIIAIANQKGGVAKTTTTHNLGVALAAAGKKVLLIDLDSQASLTISAGIEPLEMQVTIVDVLKKDGAPIDKCIQRLNDRLFIVTSIIDLAPMEMEMLSRASREKILDRALKSVQENYDYILIDCPPQLSILTINALSCADGVLIPVKTDYLAYRGLTQLMDSIGEIQELINPGLQVLGVVATLHDARVTDDREILALLKKEYNLLGVIKRLAVAKKGIYDGRAVVEQAPASEIAREYIAIADMIIEGKTEREELYHE